MLQCERYRFYVLIFPFNFASKGKYNYGCNILDHFNFILGYKIKCSLLMCISLILPYSWTIDRILESGLIPGLPESGFDNADQYKTIRFISPE